MDSYLKSLVDVRKEAYSCLKTALENIDAIVKSIGQLNENIEAYRLQSDNPSSDATTTNINKETRQRNEIPTNVMNDIPIESLEFDNQVDRDVSQREPDTTAAMSTRAITVKNENEVAVVNNNATDDCANNEEILDSVISSLSKREKLNPVVRVELLRVDEADKKMRKRGRLVRRKQSDDDYIGKKDDCVPIKRTRNLRSSKENEQARLKVSRRRVQFVVSDSDDDDDNKFVQVC